jgi:hypothetical protein
MIKKIIINRIPKIIVMPIDNLKKKMLIFTLKFIPSKPHPSPLNRILIFLHQDNHLILSLNYFIFIKPNSDLYFPVLMQIWFVEIKELEILYTSIKARKKNQRRKLNYSFKQLTI